MQRCCSTHDEGVLAVSSTSSDRQLRKHDDHTCWGGETVPPTDDEQQNADAAWRQLKRPEHSTSPGTGERIHWDTGVPSRWAYTWHVAMVRHVLICVWFSETVGFSSQKHCCWLWCVCVCSATDTSLSSIGPLLLSAMQKLVGNVKHVSVIICIFFLSSSGS